MVSSRDDRAVRAADRLLSAGAGIAGDILRGDMLQPRIALGNTARLLSASTDGMALLLGESGGAPFHEVANKLHAWYLFTWADRVHAGSPDSLTGLVAAAQRLDSYEAVWTLEGTGYRYARTALNRETPLTNLLQSEEAKRVSESVLLPLHTGLGLALAEAALEQPGAGALRPRLENFVALCQGNSREAWSEIAFEALGVPAVNLHGSSVAEIDRELSGMPGDLREYFWHGAGRGSYFAPSSFLPGMGMQAPAFQQLQAIAPGAAAHRNLAAGFAWAAALVNLRDPPVLAYAIERMSRDAGEPAIVNGVSSALRFWSMISPDDDHLAGLARFNGRSSLWDACMRQSSVASGGEPASLFRAGGGAS